MVLSVFLRHDAYSYSGFEFAVVDIIQLAIIIQALFVIGGYSSRVEMLGLTYTAEHIIAMLSALGVSALILYAAATYDHTMKPSRSVVLASFVAFTPISMLYRRALRKRVAGRIGQPRIPGHRFGRSSRELLSHVSVVTESTTLGICRRGPGTRRAGDSRGRHTADRR